MSMEEQIKIEELVDMKEQVKIEEQVNIEECGKMDVQPRRIDVKEVSDCIRKLCIEANHVLSQDMQQVIHDAKDKEESALGKKVLSWLEDNMVIAEQDMIPICQDTGMVVIFIEIGQDVHFVGGNLEEAIHEGIRKGYDEGYLRKSVVSDPLERVNTRDNTPGVIHYQLVPGREVTITVAPKGFGSENMSKICMLKPSDGQEGVMDAIYQAVLEAGPNACPPMVVGVGVGGTFEKCALLAKRALLREVGASSKTPWVAKMEQELLGKMNASGIGPGGLGGSQTVLAVHIDTYPTHIAGLPVAINICCHVNRHATITI